MSEQFPINVILLFAILPDVGKEPKVEIKKPG